MPYGRDETPLGAVIDKVVDGVVLIDAHSMILMFNPACEKLFGYSAGEVIGRNVQVLMPATERGEHHGFLDAATDSGEPRIIGGEATGQRKNGETFPMDLSVGEARQDGRVVFVGIIHDLTDSKLADQAVRESIARLRAVVDTAVDGVMLIDSRGSILMFNPACQRLFGFSVDEVLGRDVKMLMPPQGPDGRDSPLDKDPLTDVRKFVGISRDVTGLRKDGLTFSMDLSFGEARQNGDSIFVGIVHDLTDRKRTEELLVQAQKMEGVGQLSGGIAHDFNNLLTVIIGNAAALVEALEAYPELLRQAEAIVAAGERGAELTRRLLAFSRRQKLIPVEIDCNHLIASMGQLLRRVLREDIEVRTELDPGLWAAFADSGQLEAAILNLTLNARDAMPEGGCISITTGNLPLDEHYHDLHPEAPSGQYIMISVTDDGQGMAPEVLERAFDPFFTTKDVGKGSGLGLSMVYGFVNQSNGHITMYSEPGLGTTVRIYLPASSSEPVQAGEAAPIEELPLGDGVTVLVAEDDPFVRAYAVSTIESLGYRVVAAVDGRDALRQLARVDEIALLFSDIVMPGGMSGWELADRAMRLKPGLKVLLTSGYALETLASRGRLHPGTVVLNKPYRKADLARRLRDALETIH